MFENKLQGKCTQGESNIIRMFENERKERIGGAILSVYVCGAMRIGVVAFVDIFPSHRYKSCAIWHLIDRYADERAVIVTHRAD